MLGIYGQTKPKTIIIDQVSTENSFSSHHIIKLLLNCYALKLMNIFILVMGKFSVQIIIKIPKAYHEIYKLISDNISLEKNKYTVCLLH